MQQCRRADNEPMRQAHTAVNSRSADYDTIRYIYVRSKADKKASLV